MYIRRRYNYKKTLWSPSLRSTSLRPTGRPSFFRRVEFERHLQDGGSSWKHGNKWEFHQSNEGRHSLGVYKDREQIEHRMYELPCLSLPVCPLKYPMFRVRRNLFKSTNKWGATTLKWSLFNLKFFYWFDFRGAQLVEHCPVHQRRLRI